MESSNILHLLYLYIGDLSVVFLVLNVLICFFHFKKLEEPFRRLFYFLSWSLTIEILARVVLYFGSNNLPLLHLYTLGEFILLSFFYKSLLSRSAFFQKSFWFLIVGGSLLILINSLFFQSIYEFNPLAKTSVQIIIIAFSILYFYTLNDSLVLYSTVEKSLRLINSAVLLYYSGSLFIFMCNQIFFDNSDLYKIFWTFNAVLNLIFQLLILWGLWKVVFRKTPLSS